ncbi:MAG TPA: YmaF family protein [Bacilli bacterium]
MDIPVTGFMMHSGDEGEGEHSHRLYITSWGGNPVHAHEFAGITSFDAGHSHEYAGMTDAAPSGVPHTHSYYTVTSLNDGHTHVIRGVTGPAVPVVGGGHIHYFHGVTTINGMTPHAHAYSGQTGNEILPG